MTDVERYPVTAEDLDLEPPVKYRRLLIETIHVYEIWVEDYEDRGAEALAKYENESGTNYELIPKDESPIDASCEVRVPESWETGDYLPQFGPWQVCGAEGCSYVQYPAYSVDPTCHRHRVTGCQRMNLPVKDFA